MSRSNYTETDREDDWGFVMWRGAVKSAIRGKRGQALLRELVDSLEALPDKRLVGESFATADGQVCALGAVARKRGIDFELLQSFIGDPEEYENTDTESIAKTFGVSDALVREIMYLNDQPYFKDDAERFDFVLNWAKHNIRQESVTPMSADVM